jgi:hypothetical protein
MPSLSEYVNVYNTALIILQKNGYQVWYDTKSKLYFAEKGGWDFAADSPCGLLGVVSIYEFQKPATYREYWWKEDGAHIYGHLPKQPRAHKPVWEK